MLSPWRQHSVYIIEISDDIVKNIISQITGTSVEG